VIGPDSEIRSMRFEPEPSAWPTKPRDSRPIHRVMCLLRAAPLALRLEDTDDEDKLVLSCLKVPPQFHTLLNPEDSSDACGYRRPERSAFGLGNDDSRSLHGNLPIVKGTY